MRPVCLAIVTFCLLLSGCGGGSSSTTPPPPPTPLSLQSGNWDFSATSSSGPSFLIGGNVVQTGTSITGGVHVVNSTCITASTPVPITGSISGQTATVTSTAVASQTINATLSGSSTALNGTYSVTGTGCAGGDKGTLAGVLVPSVTGTWKGAFVSSVVANPTVITTAVITEGAADANGLFSLTGTATYSGSPCFASGTTATGSAISGRTNDVILKNNDGSTVEFVGFLTNPASPTQMTGTYTVSGGLCNGDSGSGTLSKQ